MTPKSALFAGFIAAVFLGSNAHQVTADPLAIRAKTIHTMAGAAIKNGIVLVRDGKIEKVGKAADITPPEDYRIIEAKVVIPGLIDAHSVVGLTGYLNQRQDQEQIDHSEPIQPELRALDAYDPQERLIDWVRSFGVTTLHTGHAPGEVVSGQTMIVKTAGKTVDDAVIVSEAMIAVTLGDGSVKGDGKAPGTRSKAVAMLRSQLIKAQAYLKKKNQAASQPADSSNENSSAANDPGKRGTAGNGGAGPSEPPPTATQPGEPGPDAQTQPAAPPEDSVSTKPPPAATVSKEKPESESAKNDPPDRDLRMEAFVRVLKREIPLLITVHRAHDIMTALRLAREFDIRIVLDGAAEAYLVREEIKAAGVPVILHPTMMRSGKGPTENAGMETASILRKAGIPFAFQSGFESYVPKTRVVLFEAGVAASNGLLFEHALAGATIDAAKILGIADRVGSIESGKDADLALYDGDPFEYTTHCVGVVIDGKLVSELVR
ncbi:MAG TPA: amidohydrolase family protein [Phycisphaerae bacterium]|nr:amidohydrolase family protein [Phycisphaerae bacterium]